MFIIEDLKSSLNNVEELSKNFEHKNKLRMDSTVGTMNYSIKNKKSNSELLLSEFKKKDIRNSV